MRLVTMVMTMVVLEELNKTNIKLWNLFIFATVSSQCSLENAKIWRKYKTKIQQYPKWSDRFVLEYHDINWKQGRSFNSILAMWEWEGSEYFSLSNELSELRLQHSEIWDLWKIDMLSWAEFYIDKFG